MFFIKGEKYIRIIIINILIVFSVAVLVINLLDSKILEESYDKDIALITQIADFKEYEGRDIIEEIKSLKSQEEKKELLKELKDDKYSIINKKSILSSNFGLIMCSIIGLFITLHTINYYYIAVNQKKYIKSIDEFINSVMDKSFDKHLPESTQGLISKLNNRFNKLGLSIRRNYQKLESEHLKMRDSLADISHQVKTPIAAISMYNEILLDSDEISNENKEFLKLTEGQIERLKWLITSILKISRFEANSITLKKEKFEISDISQNFEKLLMEQITRKKLSIAEVGDLYSEVELDFNWTSEALLNIVKNATEHAFENTEIVIHYTVNVAMIKIDVINKGKNIKEEDLNKVFNRFYKSGNSNNPESVGIGLNLSKQIVERQMGTISVQNLDDGVQFSVVFLR